MDDKNYFSHLYDIASHLNKEFSLHSALRKSLEKTAEILNIETGWIWLTEPDNKSVYLAVSYNLPPGLSDYPERLSGWCYCIKQYLSDDMEQATNISEIACSRLKDVRTGTNDLKFHATIPIIINGQKIGLINLLTKETRKLEEEELKMLNTISELIGTAVQRTRVQQYDGSERNTGNNAIQRVSETVLIPKINAIVSCLQSSRSDRDKVSDVLEKASELQKDLNLLLEETTNSVKEDHSGEDFNYPQTPLTKRELQVLQLIKEGHTNEQIGTQLYITERTVKFHTTSILSKLSVKNRTEAVDVAFKRGLLSL